MSELIIKKQYLDADALLSNIKIYDFPPTDLISADTYNEEIILENFKKFQESDQILLIKCAIHIAVIGYGNRTYGKIRDNDKVLEISDVFKKLNILFNKNINEKYDSGFISARRLIRLLRYHISSFITRSNRPSYLWFKYSDRDISKINICFPGGEHLVETSEDATYLLNTYYSLDARQNTKFVERLTRVFIARGILLPQFFTTFVPQQLAKKQETQIPLKMSFVPTTSTTSTTTTSSIVLVDK